jgi:hypothetical protein
MTYLWVAWSTRSRPLRLFVDSVIIGLKMSMSLFIAAVRLKYSIGVAALQHL